MTTHRNLRFNSTGLLFGTILSMMPGTPAPGATFPLSTFDRLQGLIVYDIAEDAAGNIWLGTDTGVWRWRINGFEPIISPTGFSSNSSVPRGWAHGATTLACTTDQTLWIGTGRGLLALDMASHEPRPVPESLRNTPINRIRCLDDGTLYICTPIGLYVLSRKDGRPKAEAQPGMSGLSIQDVARVGGALWVATNTDVREITSHGTKTFLDTEITGRTVTLLVAGDGAVWIGARSKPGLYRYANGRMRKFDAADGLSNQEVNCLSESAPGEIWIGTEHGAFLWRNNGFMAIDRERGLEHDDVHAILIDHEDETWIGTFGGGAYLLRSPEIVIYTAADGLAEPFVSSMCRLDKSALIVGSLRGLSRFDTTTGTGRPLDVHRLTQSLCEDTAGKHWIGGHRSIECLETNEKIDVGDEIVQMSASRDAGLLVCTESSLFHVHQGQVNQLNHPDELGRRVSAALLDRSGMLFVGAENGVAFRPEADSSAPWTVVRTPDSVKTLVESGTGEIWIGTQGSIGVLSADATRFEERISETGIVNAFAFSSNGVLWSGTEQGLLRISADRVERITLSDGLPSPDIRSLLFLDANTLLAGTTSGLARIDTDRIAFNDRPPRISVEVWSASESQSRGNQGGLVVESNDQGLIAFVTTIGRRNTEGMRYRYRIEGSRESWSSWSPERRRRLSHLPPGRFAIQMQGKNANGAVSADASAQFEILAPYWQTTPFLFTAGLLCLSGAISMGFLVHKRTHYLRRIEQSERRFRSLIESIRAIPYELNAETLRFSYVGPQSQSIIGFPASQWSEADFLEKQSPPDDVERIQNGWRAAQTRDCEITVEHRMQAANGEMRWLKNIISPLETGAKSPILRGLMVDVSADYKIAATERALREELEDAVRARTASLTETNDALRAEIDHRKRIEGDLRSSEERFSKIFDASPIAMFLSRLNGETILSANDSYLNMTGRSRAEVIGRSGLELGAWGAPDEQKRFADEIRRCGGMRDHLVKIQSKSGEPRLNRISAEILKVAGESCVITIADDVTDRIAAEQEIERQRAFMRQLIDINPNIIFTKDSSLRYTLANKALAEFFGSTPDEVVGRLDSDFNPDFDEIESYNRIDREVIENRREILVPEERVTDARGRAHYFQTVKLPLVTANGVGLLGIATDITARKAVEDDLRRAHADLRAVNEKLEERVRERTRDLEETKLYLQQVLETSPSLIFVKDAEGRFLFGNRAVMNAFGRPWREMAGRKVSDVHSSAENATSYEAGDREVVSSLRSLTTVEKFNSPDGQEMWFKVVKSPLIRPDGEVQIMGIATNITEQIRSEAELRESIARFQLIARGAIDGLWDVTIVPEVPWNSPDTLVYYSERFKALLGFADDEFPNRLGSWMERLHPEDRDRVFKALERHIAQESGYEIEYRLRTKSGDFRWFQARGQAAWDEAGRLYRMAGSLNDITRRKEAEEHLHRQALVFDNMYDGVILTDLGGKISDWNRGAERIFGFTRDEMLGESPEILNRTAEARKLTEMIQSALVQEGQWSGEIRFIRRDGGDGVCEVLVINLLDDAGRRVGVVSFNRDITDRKRAEGQSRLFADIVNNMQTGLYVWQSRVNQAGSDLYLVMANPAACAYSETHRERLVGQSHSDQFPGLLQKETPEICREVIRTQRVHDLGEIHVNTNGPGNPRMLTAKAFPLPNRCVGMAFEDITAQKAAEAQRNKFEEQLQQAQKLEVVGSVASSIAHEFENLLTTISAYADIAKSSLTEDHPASRHLDKVETTARHARGATQALLTFSRRSTVAKSAINLTETMSETLTLLGRVVPNRIEMHSNLRPKEPLWIYADASQIEQMLLNLVINAKDATPGQGQITISLDSTSEPPLELSSDVIAPNQTAVIIVSDSGRGISPESMKRIFEPFYTTKSRGEGTGLGLSITLGIVENLGGRIQAESQLGKGTTFRIEIPCCPPKKESAVTLRRRTRTTQDVVVVMERNPQVRSIITSTLRATGCDVKPATHMVEAISLARRGQSAASLMIIDLDAVSREDLEHMGVLRAERGNMKMILVVGTLAADFRQFPMENCYIIRKPFEMPELSELVEACLAGRQTGKGPGNAERSEDPDR